MATAMEQASTNAGVIGSAAEQMALTLNEIAENSVKGRTITDNAVSQGQVASGFMDKLSGAAQEIGKVENSNLTQH